MNPVFLALILIPILEIYLFIKIGSQIGAFKTIFLIFLTAIIGMFYARFEGLKNLNGSSYPNFLCDFLYRSFPE